jgi:hypothetical protein
MLIKKFYKTILSSSCVLFSVLFSISFAKSNAQSCQGTLGAPVIDITFGSGATNPGPQLSAVVPGASTTYNYASYATGTPPAAVDDGDYALINEVPVNEDWFTGATDHTGNTNGYMAFFNASPAPGQFYKQNVTALVPGTTYQFSAWIANVVNGAALPLGVLPNITFQILDTTTQDILATYNTGDIPNSLSMTWNQYSFLFTVPEGLNTATLELTNNNVGGTDNPGNDLAIDDITFSPCLANMPVVLKGFQGTIINQSAQLSWTTFDEVNTAFDVIQRSYDGSDFTTVGSLPAKGSLQQNQYQFADYPSFSNPTVFYRLKLIDKDGKYTYSNTLAFPLGKQTPGSVKLFPNPATNYVQLTYISTKYETTTIKVTDISGKTVLTQTASTTPGTNAVTLNFQNKLVSGTYIIQFVVNGQNQVNKVVVN